MSAPDTDPVAGEPVRPTITADELPPSPPPRKRRGIPGLRSMVISMLVLLALMFGFYAIVARPDRVDRLPVDSVAAVTNARTVAGQDFSALDPLPSGWRANNAVYQPGPDGVRTWSVGYVHGDVYNGVRQAAAATPGWYAGTLASFRQDGEQQLGGGTWERWVNPTTNEHRLVRRGEGGRLSTVVVSSVSYEDAAAFAARLTPAP